MPTAQPTATVEAVPTEVVEAPTPTAEVAPTPITDPLAALNRIITFIENNSPPDVPSRTWEVSKNSILEGFEEQGGNFGLYDVRAALEGGDYRSAAEKISPGLFQKVAFIGIDEYTIWSEEEINMLDPEHLLISEDPPTFPVANFSIDAAVELIRIKYFLEG